VVEKQPVAIGIAKHRLAPQVGLIGGLLVERDALRLQLADQLVEPVGLEVDADRALLDPTGPPRLSSDSVLSPSGQTNRAYPSLATSWIRPSDL
jgi:hypothetical protein